MAQAKALNWKAVMAALWDEPSEDVYYCVNRWKAQGYRDVLDLGCGRHALLSAQQGFDTAAFDLSPEGLEVLRGKAAAAGVSIDIRQSDIHHPP